MAEQSRVHTPRPQDRPRQDSTGQAGDAHPKANTKTIQRGKRIKDEIDQLVDEIDEVLEKYAFKEVYVQQGGE